MRRWDRYDTEGPVKLLRRVTCYGIQGGIE